MNILLTGGTGYLGSHLVEYLLRDGHNIACLVRDIQNLKRLSKLQDRVSIISMEQMEIAMKQLPPEIVIHTACTYSRGGNTAEDILTGNFLFPLSVLQTAVTAGTTRWINTDTCLPPRLNSYALSKKQFCQWGQLYAEQGKIQFINLQLEHFYGTDAPEDQFLTWVIKKLRRNEPLELTAGTQKRDFIYIDDVLRVYAAILESRIEDAYIDIPVGTGISSPIREVVEYLKECTHSNSELRFGAIPARSGELDSVCDIHKLRKIGAVPQIYWKDGMKNIL